VKIDAFSIISVNAAIDKLTNYRNKIDSTFKNEILELTKRGYEYMISIVREDTGNLKSSITWEYDESGNKGIIKVGSDYGIFVEFGTGIVGADSPHPNAENWRYDVNSHGEKGWFYFDNKQNRIRWTKGQTANAFVYQTAEYLKKEASEKIKVIING
jgi:hypothetical protein